MAIKLSQNLKQTQGLMMTPQLQQAIKLLTLTHLEMTNVIADEMVENPMLEEMDTDERSGEVKDGEMDYKVDNLEKQNEEIDATQLNEKVDNMPQDDFDWSGYIESYNSTSYAQPSSMVGSSGTEEMPNYENMVSVGQTLADHLIWQLQMEDLSDKECELAYKIIHNINDDGYLDVPFEELIAELDFDRECAYEVLKMVQRLDPVGCGASDLVECLLAQVQIAEERSPLLEEIIKNHLGDLQSKDFGKIANATGVSKDVIKDTAQILQNFHPRPGRMVSGQTTHYVVPDIYVEEVAGEFVVVLNEEGVPRLKISNLYRSLIGKSSASVEEDSASDYIKDKLRSAMWLIRSIQNRQKTIHKVAEAIVKEQQQFFQKGPMYLKPMVLRDIARDIDMHESTVSRVTTNKYMHTPIGVFELKFFFSSGIGSKNGDAGISSEVLKMKIKTLVENENPRSPLSDQKILELLKHQNIDVARRTVAKYREMLGILSSSKRKRKD